MSKMTPDVTAARGPETVNIYRPRLGNGQYGRDWCVTVVNCEDLAEFTRAFADAFVVAFDLNPSEDRKREARDLLALAFPLAFKLAGYKQDIVRERRTLISGVIEPNDEELFSDSGPWPK